MAIRCRVYKCKFNNGGWCRLDMICIDVNGKCEEFEDDCTVVSMR